MKPLLNTLTDIPAKVYEGYVWYSDEQKPKTINNEWFQFTESPINPFVVEAMLYCKDDNTSVMIKHTGRYIISYFDLNDLPKDSMLKDKPYLPHRLDDFVKKVCFQQIWIPEKDGLCEDMPVMTLKAIAFVGFNKPTKN